MLGHSLSALVNTIIDNAVKEYNVYSGAGIGKDVSATDVMNIKNIYMQVMPYDKDYFEDKPMM